MNLLKVGAVVIGGIVVFFVVDSVIHLFLGLLAAVVFVAIVGGGIYAAGKIVKAVRRKPELRERPDYGSGQQEAAAAASRPVPGASVAHRPDVEDELSRLKREMGH